MRLATLKRRMTQEQLGKLYRARDDADTFAETVWAGEAKWEDAKGRFTPFNRRGEATGFVYFVRVLDYVKIGFTRQNPHARVASLQTGCPLPIGMIGFVFADHDLERELHWELREHRAEGEWFSLKSPDVRKAVRRILNTDAR